MTILVPCYSSLFILDFCFLYFGWLRTFEIVENWFSEISENLTFHFISIHLGRITNLGPAVCYGANFYACRLICTIPSLYHHVQYGPVFTMD